MAHMICISYTYCEYSGFYNTKILDKLAIYQWNNGSHDTSFFFIVIIIIIIIIIINFFLVSHISYMYYMHHGYSWWLTMVIRPSGIQFGL